MRQGARKHLTCMQYPRNDARNPFCNFQNEKLSNRARHEHSDVRRPKCTPCWNGCAASGIKTLFYHLWQWKKHSHASIPSVNFTGDNFDWLRFTADIRVCTRSIRGDLSYLFIYLIFFVIVFLFVFAYWFIQRLPKFTFRFDAEDYFE